MGQSCEQFVWLGTGLDDANGEGFPFRCQDLRLTLNKNRLGSYHTIKVWSLQFYTIVLDISVARGMV